MLGLAMTTAPGAAPGAVPGSAAQLPAVEPITPIAPVAATLSGEAVLGKALFGESRLSGHGRLSCASCHDIASNGADTRRFDVGDDGTRLPVNTNTVFNAVLSFRLNWVGDARTFADQARQSLFSPRIMGSSPAVLASLANEPALGGRFREIYGRPLDAEGVETALAAFEATLVTPDSRFDRLLRGDRSALDPVEQAGYTAFKTVGCIACHQGVGIGGNLWQRHGIFSLVTASDRMVLRVPSLRDVATTPPYFHDGSAPTLTAAVSDMARVQLGRGLSDDQTAAIVAFLGTLTGRYDGRPVHVAPMGAPGAVAPMAVRGLAAP